MGLSKDLISETWTVVDPKNDDLLEAWLLFCIAVAGKTAKGTAKCINTFLEPRGNLTPFEYVQTLIRTHTLLEKLQLVRIGQYSKLSIAFVMVSLYWTPEKLRTCTLEDLEKIHGVGPKTSRFFLQSTRSGTRFAVLDTHILAWMREQGYDVPKVTPSGKRYLEIEKQYLELADSLGVTSGELDAEVWRSQRV